MMMNKRQTAIFCSQLRSLLASGMPLMQALEIIKDLPQSKKHRSRIKEMIDRINDGYSLSEAMVGLLPTMVVGSLSAAERAGDLEGALDRMHRYFAEKADLDEKLIGAMIYPLFVAALSFLSLLVLIMFVIPGMKGLFNELDASLPPITNFVLAGGELFCHSWLFIIFVVGIALAVFYRLKNKEPDRIEKFIFRTPFIGRLYKQEMIIQGLGMLGSLLAGGMPIIGALEITASSSKSLVFKKFILKAKEEVENGGRLSESLEKSNFFGQEVIQMLKVGENSGQLAEMLVSISDFLSKEREVLLKRFTVLLEPSMTLMVGVVVGFIVLAMLLPIVNMVSSLQ